MNVTFCYICMSLQNELGGTALQAASLHGHLVVMAILLRRGAFIDFTNGVSLWCKTLCAVHLLLIKVLILGRRTCDDQYQLWLEAHALHVLLSRLCASIKTKYL